MDRERFEEIYARHRAEEEKAWWKDMTSLVSKTDKQMVVIGLVGDLSPDMLRMIGQTIACWKAEFPQSRHIWGLVDLLDGRYPRTPPIYICVPYSMDGFAEAYERVALVYVAKGTNLEEAATNLYDRLSDFHNQLALFMHPDEYSRWNR